MKTLVTTVAGKHRMWVYHRDHNPPHVHVVGPGCHVKINVRTLELIRVRGYSEADTRKLVKLVEHYREVILEVWEDLYGKE